MKSVVLALLICDLGGAGTAEQGQPLVDRFLRHLEQKAGWSEKSIVGGYRTTAESCQAYVDEHEPALAITDLSTFLRERRAWKLRPLAQMGSAASTRYYVLVRPGTLRKLAELKGKKIVSVVSDQRFVYRVVLGGKLRPRGVSFEATSRPLNALRAVSRGRADAALVDEATYRAIGELRLPSPLEVLYTSPALPGLTLAMAGARANDKQLRQKVMKALPELCAGAGAELCKSAHVSGFTAVDRSQYTSLIKKYR